MRWKDDEGDATACQILRQINPRQKIGDLLVNNSPYGDAISYARIMGDRRGEEEEAYNA